MRTLILALLLLFTAFAYPQDKILDKRNALVTIRGNVGIPRGISSQMFRTCFAGVYEANLSVNVRLFGNFFIGVGYQNSHFQNNKFLKFQYFKASIPYNTRLMAHSGFMKIGIDKFFSPTGYMSYSLNSGLMQVNYLHVNADTNLLNRPYGLQTYITPYLQPEMAVNFIVDEKQKMSLSIFVAYATVLSNFDPKGPRFNHFEEVSKKNNRYYMSWFNIGFGFTVLLDRKAKA
ncbi:MAG: hypothetical protein H0W61_05830 [Bacteroidetes bacterium]|nr:hypothetical protein [Bacteroidota bacterium]